MTGLFDFLLGTYTLRVPPEERTAVFRCLLGAVLPVCSVENAEDGAALLTMRTRNARKLFSTLADAGIACPEIIGRQGLPVYLSRWKKRPGIPVGAAVIAGIILASSLFVWRVDVICLDNETAARADDYVDTEAVKERLGQFGVAPGLFLPTFSARFVEHDYLRGQNEISWMAINRKGTVLSVEVRPARAVTESHTGELHTAPDGTLRGADLTADGDGIIVRYEIQNGIPNVLPGQFVTAGEVLASGIFEAKDGDTHFSYAEGKVFAKTLRTFRTEIPFDIPETVPTGAEERLFRVRIFGKDVTFLEILQKLLPNTGIVQGEYDIIEKKTGLFLPDGTPLPVEYSTIVKRGRETRLRHLSREEAAALAKEKTEQQIASCPDLTVLSVETEQTETADGVLCTAYVYCVDNIAQTTEFSLSQTGYSSATP